MVLRYYDTTVDEWARTHDLSCCGTHNAIGALLHGWREVSHRPARSPHSTPALGPPQARQGKRGSGEGLIRASLAFSECWGGGKSIHIFITGYIVCLIIVACFSL